MYMEERGFGASNAGANIGSMTATGATVGSVIPGIGTAIGAAVGAVAGIAQTLLAGHKHYSPWGFLYDAYPDKIYQNEVQIRAIRRQIEKMNGRPPTPDMNDPPPLPSPITGGAAYQATMQNIVPYYVPGSGPAIAAYDRKLNEAGGAFEVTYAKQLATLQAMNLAMQQQQVQLAQATPPAVMLPAPGGSPSGYAPAPAMTFPGASPYEYAPMTSSVPQSPLSLPSPQATAQAVPAFQAGLSALPLLIIMGGAGLLLMMGGKKGH